MKKLLLIYALFILTINCCCAETLRATVVKDEIPKGFFGTWHVTSKMVETNNSELFNPLSVDIWTLGGYGNTLILENVQSGASSSITVESQKNLDGKTLKFVRVKSNTRGNMKIVQRESPVFTLKGDIFQGFDTYVIERYVNNQLIKKDVVKYKVVGQKISGDRG